MCKQLIFILISLLIAAGIMGTVVGSIQAADEVCEWIYHVGFMYTLCPRVGIGLSNPGERLHLGDGNFLIEGGGETAIKIKRDITYPRAITVTGVLTEISRNPIFQIGRIIQAGDGDPELRFLYSDDHTDERAIFELDRKGIAASVKTDRGSHFEALSQRKILNQSFA
jgi:hypothetical protein